MANSSATKGGPVYVLHRHHARTLHYDLRLEVDGVLKSWAVPKGPSLDPGDKRLAVEVPDHQLDYATFEGTIAAGEYGAGRVEIADRGTWRPVDASTPPAGQLAAGKLAFELTGQRLAGRFTLIRTRMRSGSSAAGPSWLLVKATDAAARPGIDIESLLANVPFAKENDSH